MVCKPQRGRSNLIWHIFEKKSSNTWVLVLPTYYAELFSQLEPALMEKSSNGWRTAQSGRARYMYLRDVTTDDIDRIKQFVADYHQLRIIGLSDILYDHFSDELDFCLALDVNALTPEDYDRNRRTEIGELLHRIKYRGMLGIAPRLVQRLERAFFRIPHLANHKNICLSYIPPDPQKDFDLPMVLTELLSRTRVMISVLKKDVPVVHPVMKKPKPAIKEINWERKIKVWERIYQKGHVSLNENVNNCAVCVIDDLYQSGTTMWSYAGFLKSQGAEAVYGLTCVKTLSDRSNV